MSAAGGGEEFLRDRLRAFLAFARPKILAAGTDFDRLSQLRRLSDVRIRAFAVGRPTVTGLDLCELLADPKTGRLDALAGGLLRRADLEARIEPLGQAMGALVEACLLLQVLGAPAMEALLKEGAASLGALTDAPSAPRAPAAAISPAARPLAAAKELWTAPAAPLRAMKLLEERDPKPDLVAAEVEKDSAIVSRFLRIAGALGGTRLASVNRAVVGLGFPMTRRVLGTAMLAPKLGADPEFWSHALRVASAASLASKAAKIGNPDEHWVAGLLHEAGAPIKARHAPTSDVPAAEFGAFLLERWKFPAGVVAAARHHADSVDAIEDASLPREAVAAAACCRLVRGEGGRWTALLRLTPTQAVEVAAGAERLAKASLDEFLAMG
ncbi:MAG TPA: HDOD domain-containing protein [Planctomycetota bacterium]